LCAGEAIECEREADCIDMNDGGGREVRWVGALKALVEKEPKVYGA
jgi:hypothetical protein